MKKNFTLTALLLAALTSTFIISCIKEKEERTSRDNCFTKETDDIYNLDEYLMLFKKKLLDESFSKETISLDQAQRDFGDLLNFDFGDANYPTNKYQRDTICLNIPTAAGSVYLKDLAEAYKKARKVIDETYQVVDLPEKSICAIACSINKSSKDDSDAEIQLILITRGLATDVPFKYSIDTTDNWHVGQEMGKCNGTWVGYDHASVIAIVFNNNHPPVDCANGRLYYTDIVNDGFHSFDFPATGPGSEYSGYLFWDGTYYEMMNHCVEYPEMLYYYNNFCQIMDNLLPVGYVFVVVECLVDTVVSYEYYPFGFSCYYTTAKPNCTNEPIH